MSYNSILGEFGTYDGAVLIAVDLYRSIYLGQPQKFVNSSVEIRSELVLWRKESGTVAPGAASNFGNKYRGSLNNPKLIGAKLN